MDFAGAIKEGFQRYSRFDGVSSRAAFWYWRLFVALVAFATAFMPVIGNLISLAIFVPDAAVSIRRSRDSGFSAWFQALWLLPAFAFMWVVKDLLIWFSGLDVDVEQMTDRELLDLFLQMIPIIAPVIFAFLAVQAFFLVTYLMPTKTRAQGNKLVK